MFSAIHNESEVNWLIGKNILGDVFFVLKYLLVFSLPWKHKIWEWHYKSDHECDLPNIDMPTDKWDGSDEYETIISHTPLSQNVSTPIKIIATHFSQNFRVIKMLPAIHISKI